MKAYIDRAMPEIGKHVSQLVLHPLHDHDTKILTELADNYALLSHGRNSKTQEATHVAILLNAEGSQVNEVVALMNQLTADQRKQVMGSFCACCGKPIGRRKHYCDSV